ncbi:MAG: FAD-binding protein, partial [Myxococcota bacterium]
MTEANAAAFAGEISESSVTGFDAEVDVLVVGTGAGGMTAALKAHDEGGRVLVIEKTDQYGGSSAMSSCLLWLPNNHLMPELGIDDSADDAMTYLRGTTKGAVAEARLEAFVARGPEMLRYLVDQTQVEVVGLPEYPDYYPGIEGSKPGGRSVEPAHF